jgi:hypothetical protein
LFQRILVNHLPTRFPSPAAPRNLLRPPAARRVTRNGTHMGPDAVQNTATVWAHESDVRGRGRADSDGR